MPQVYKDGMDIALLTFLLACAAVECCNLILMRGWRQAGQLHYGSGFARGASRLLWRWHALTAVLVAAFAGVAFGVREVAEPLTRRSLDGLAGTILIVGDIGYLLFAVGLLNALALLSTDRVLGGHALAGGRRRHQPRDGNRARASVRRLSTRRPGLAAGGAVFAVETSRKLHRTLEDADTLSGTA